MLSHLQISNFTLVDQLEVELSKGLTALTGETGAGKSIMLDALGLVLGERADADKVRHGAERADIQASFHIGELPFVNRWLDEHELSDDGECLLRRVVTREGRSRGFINGQAVTLQQLKHLGEMLIDIHNQHEHQSLLKPSTHLRLLDEFGNLRTLAKDVKRAYYRWHTHNEQLESLNAQTDEIDARFQLLSYQVGELDERAIEPGEVESLETEQKQLANIEQTQQNCQHIVDLCNDDRGPSAQLHTALRLLAEIAAPKTELDSARSLFEQALINIDEAQADIERAQATDNLDQARLPKIETRLSNIYDIARKHRVNPEKLHILHAELNKELNSLRSGDEQIEQIEQELQERANIYNKLANKLSKARKSAATKLSTQINAKLSQLAMAHASLYIDLKPLANDTPVANGNEHVQFLISTSPGQSPLPLAKIASGGELSRISLAIQVITAQTSTIPTLIFDEVDVGIGGITGDVVGKLLRELGDTGQVICVTHLAQVASKGHQHWRVEKVINENGVQSSLHKLNNTDKVAEIARMMGGTIDSQQSLAHAREMLESAE